MVADQDARGADGAVTGGHRAGERIERIAALLGRPEGRRCCSAGPLVARTASGRRAGSRRPPESVSSSRHSRPSLERRAGLPAFPRLGFYPQQAAAQLEGTSHVLVAGAHEPVALFFAYLNRPSPPVPADAETSRSSPDVHEDAARALADLAAIVAPTTARETCRLARPAMPSGPLTLQSWPQGGGGAPPEDSIIVDESISFWPGTPSGDGGRPPHDLPA